MNRTTIGITLLVIFGIYFALFHTAPFPLNHESIGLPPLHTVHTVFGLVLLAAAGYVWKKNL